MREHRTGKSACAVLALATILSGVSIGRASQESVQTRKRPPGQVHVPKGVPAPFQRIATYSIKDSKVRVQGRMVTLSASISAQDVRPGSYVWEFSATDFADPAKKRAIVYLNQVFSLPDHDDHLFTFNDAMVLAPGQYRAKLKLYRIDANAGDIGTVVKNGMRGAEVVLSKGEIITIKP